MDARIIGERVRRLRQQRVDPLSQEDLALLLGIDQASISKWENGKARPDIAKLPLLAQILNTSVDALLSPAEGSAA